MSSCTTCGQQVLQIVQVGRARCSRNGLAGIQIHETSANQHPCRLAVDQVHQVVEIMSGSRLWLSILNKAPQIIKIRSGRNCVPVRPDGGRTNNRIDH